ncbi:hypothetical protein [Endozoicomonas elysicola]|uniref:Glycosyl hydrolases family 2 sugar binding domain-containing protein n=1 Tax=Endozoicomonas elysicola TaxID=305900 RepID=A0A081K8T4_9GAMM|nr:hypothetical protein [Endozoicomonas elysicola]KEI70560.1 hypothetical protein GV64_07250 [Endozoicomonas elysicola]
MKLYRVLSLLFICNLSSAFAEEIGKISASISNNQLNAYEVSGAFTGQPEYSSEFAYDFAYNSWRLTSAGGKVSFPVKLDGHEKVYAKFTWAGWGAETLVNIYFNDQPIASGHEVHGHAWNSPAMDTFEIVPGNCSDNCKITLELDQRSPMVLFMKDLTLTTDENNEVIAQDKE